MLGEHTAQLTIGIEDQEGPEFVGVEHARRFLGGLIRLDRIGGFAFVGQ